MTENRIKEGLNTAVKNMTPDILEDLMAELEISDTPVELMQDAIRDTGETGDKWIPGQTGSDGIIKWRKQLIGLAATLVLVVTGISFATAGRDPMALVSLDVNPGIEMTIDTKERVLEANPINDEAVQILEDMDLKGTDIDVACNAIVGSMLTHGYLSDLSNSILLSVSTDDEQKGTEIEERLSNQINKYLENSEIAAAILGQYGSNDEGIRAFADQNGISLGKAWLIKNLMSTGSVRMKESDLLGLSTQELILLGQKRGVAKSTSYGNAESSRYIGEEKALSIALEKAGVGKDDVTEIEYEFDVERGVLIYEVSFRAGDYEYEYEINAYNGNIVSYEKEYEPVSRPQGSGNQSGSSGGGSSGSSSGNNASNGSASSGSSGVVRSGDDLYKSEGGVVYEYDEDDGKWEREKDKKIQNGKVYEYDDGKWKLDDDDDDDD